jgi:bile acid:Na+ symporter, BASS family
MKNTSFIFVLAMALGLAYPGPSHSMEPLIAPALVMMMTFALTEIDLSTRGDLPGALAGMALNYLLLSGLILGMASFLDDEALWNGFVVMAAVPPAVAVLPMTRLLGGDTKLSLYSEALSYIISLIAMPLIILAFAGTSGVGFWYALKASVTMVLVPIILSRFVKRLHRGLRVDPVTPINLGFFIVTYTVIGLNQSGPDRLSEDLCNRLCRLPDREEAWHRA